MAIIELTKKETDDYVQDLYSCFETGRDFEVFLNAFLSKLGFEEVVTTKYVGDKGIDLTCIKRGFDTNGTDTVNYYVQAKRYAKTNKIQASEIRDLKGTTKRDRNGNILNNKFVNLFITTSYFTSGAKEEATENPNMPVILIDGAKLLSLCIENGIGFNFKPVFSKNGILDIIKPQEVSQTEQTSDYTVERRITQNDVRSKILAIPQIIKSYIAEDCFSVELTVNGVKKKLNIDKTRRYFGGVTKIFRQSGLITPDGTYISKNSKWKITEDGIIVDIR